MRRSRTDEADFRAIASELGIDILDVRRSVSSFFEIISRDARSLPFDDERRIYKRDKFLSLVKVRQIPFLGRLGPVYSRYLCWRRNEAALQEQERKEKYRVRLTEDDIEEIARKALAGEPLPEIRKKRGSEMFNRVWIVGQDGKKSARQVLPKKD